VQILVIRVVEESVKRLSRRPLDEDHGGARPGLWVAFLRPGQFTEGDYLAAVLADGLGGAT
jgi:hypothetical protein